jgi:hypothetical protein
MMATAGVLQMVRSCWVGVVDLHSQRSRAKRHCLSDPPHSDDPQHLPGQLSTDQRNWRSVCPLAGADELLRRVGTTRRAKQQEDHRIGYRVSQNAGRVRDGDVPASG